LDGAKVIPHDREVREFVGDFDGPYCHFESVQVFAG
jgi:hypothetical protein